MSARKIRTCKRCYFDNPGEASKCNKCGNSFERKGPMGFYIDNENTNNFEYRWVCPKCSAKNMWGNRQCHNCDYEEKSSSCFLTTTVCDILGKEDNCTTLSKMRAFRSNHLETNKNGQILLEEYKELSNYLVPKINNDMEKESLCLYLEQNYINPIVELIDTNHNENAIQKYKNMVEYLLDKYK